jgi:hypothetical protein
MEGERKAMDCHKHNSLLVRKENRAGTFMYTYQCLVCGGIDHSKTGHGVWIPKPATVDLDSIPLWNEEIAQAAAKAAKFAAESAQADRDQEWWDRYHSHLQSDYWHALRQKALRRDKWLCQGCLECAAEEIHHLTYERLGHELLCDVVSLCIDCHRRCHPHKDMRGRKLHGRAITVH